MFLERRMHLQWKEHGNVFHSPRTSIILHTQHALGDVSSNRHRRFGFGQFSRAPTHLGEARRLLAQLRHRLGDFRRVGARVETEASFHYERHIPSLLQTRYKLKKPKNKNKTKQLLQSTNQHVAGTDS